MIFYELIVNGADDRDARSAGYFETRELARAAAKNAYEYEIVERRLLTVEEDKKKKARAALAKEVLKKLSSDEIEALKENLK